MYISELIYGKNHNKYSSDFNFGYVVLFAGIGAYTFGMQQSNLLEVDQYITFNANF